MNARHTEAVCPAPGPENRLKSPIIFFSSLLLLTTPAAHATPEQPHLDGATYAVRMRNIQAAVDEEKERTRRNRIRLSLLSDSVSGARGAATAEISFHEDVTSDFVLVRALVQLDGTVQYDKRDETGALAAVRDIPVFSGSIGLGNHTVQVALTYRGSGFGVFAYMRGYRVEVQSSHVFSAPTTHPVKVVMTGAQVGGATTPIDRRIAVHWHVDSGPPAQTEVARPATTSRANPSDADPSILAPLEAALAPYGSWIDDTAFGHVWVPSPSIVGPRFIPYVTGGHWTYDGVADVGGDFTWISDWAWGWAPFHLGTWVQTSAGWAWIPGRTYAPAHVVWRVDEQAHGAETVVGWSPAAPTYVWRNGSAVVVTPPREPAVYVKANDVFSTDLSSKVLPNATLDGRTRVADHTAPRGMGITVLPVTTPIGDASITHARDFSTRGSDTTTVMATSPRVDTTDADTSVLAETHDTLAASGTWSDDATYGTVWTPSPAIVGADFTPYVTGGHWTYDASASPPDYTWVSDYAWGSVTFHRGRWVRAGSRWSWIPGKVQRGAWVTWTTDANGAVGWAPIPPSYVWRNGVPVAFTMAAPPIFSFVSLVDLLALDVAARRVGGEHVPRAILERAPPPPPPTMRVVVPPPPPQLRIAPPRGRPVTRPTRRR
jgi:hypothetical protein